MKKLKPQVFIDHLQWLTDIQGLSPSTVLMASRDLKIFLNWLSFHGLKIKATETALKYTETKLRR